jgi:hypothetical protein
MTSFLALFRVVGYGLLLLTVFDVISTLVPPQIGNPAWNFSTAGELVERAAVPLIGFILVFYGNQEARKKRELLLLKLLSWFCLLLGVIYLGMVVIFFITSPTLQQSSQEQINAQLEPKIKQIEQLQAQIQKAEPSQIENLMKAQRIANTTPDAFKAKALSEAAAAQKNIKTQADMAASGQRNNLIKRSVKWGLGALVTGVLFIKIWAGTAWARE